MKIASAFLTLAIATLSPSAHALYCESVNGPAYLTIRFTDAAHNGIQLIYGRSVAFQGTKFAATQNSESFNQMQLLDPVSGRTRGPVPGVMNVVVTDKGSVVTMDVQEEQTVSSFVCKNL
jgi:hypothetical protein